MKNIERMQALLSQIMPTVSNTNKIVNMNLHFDKPNHEFIVIDIRENPLSEKNAKYSHYNFYEWQSDADHQKTLNDLKLRK